MQNMLHTHNSGIVHKQIELIVCFFERIGKEANGGEGGEIEAHEFNAIRERGGLRVGQFSCEFAKETRASGFAPFLRAARKNNCRAEASKYFCCLVSYTYR